MAVAKMEMMNVVGPIEEIDNIAKEIVNLGNVHIVNACHEIDESNFTLSVLEKNIDELVDMCVIKPYREEINHKDMILKIENLMKYLQIKPFVEEKYLKDEYDFFDTKKEIDRIYEEIEIVYKEVEKLNKEHDDLKEFDNHIKYIKGLDVNLDSLNNLHFFNYKMGILSKENRLKLKKNYENISAVVLHIGSNNVGEVYLVISTKELETETDRILRSLHFQELDIPKEFTGTPMEVALKIEKKKEEIKEKINLLSEKLREEKEKYQNNIGEAYSRLKMEEAKGKIKNEMACTKNFFYFSGWVPEREKKLIQNRFDPYGDRVIVTFKQTSEVYQYMIPPTKLKNNWILRPFEALVKMYGIPSYNELDPTMFLSITYMILFGAMFGDVGQGLVLSLMGLYFREKGLFGKILIRLGLSSAFFGVLYGSVFGFEGVIKALLIRPIENIDTMLTASVLIGILLLFISFIYGVVNAVKKRDLKEGLFGRNGLAGLLFYGLFLILFINGWIKKELIPNKICYIFMSICMLLIVVRQPLSNFILKKKPLHEESLGSYYTESGFEILETVLNMLSSTVSFIRVGAFALNHVGLFIAFHTMAKITNHFAGSILIYMIGNMIVIGLEGLIVFIQGLRLEYYEMFSKYYEGEGVEFNPIGLKVES